MLRGSIHHVSLTVSNLDEAMKFFTPFLRFIGYVMGKRIQDLPRSGEKGASSSVQ